eukprot:SAG31_NODE_23045_length_512_cov_1.375303_2_plen_82_part_01
MYGDKVFSAQPTGGGRPSSAPETKMESALRSEFGRPRELVPEFPWSTAGTGAPHFRIESRRNFDRAASLAHRAQQSRPSNGM